MRWICVLCEVVKPLLYLAVVANEIIRVVPVSFGRFFVKASET